MTHCKSVLRELPIGCLEVDSALLEGARVDDVDDRLMKSIAEAGVLNPLVVHPTNVGFQVIDGIRRLACLTWLNAERVPCMIHERLAPGDRAYLRFVLNSAGGAWEEKKRGVLENGETNARSVRKGRARGRLEPKRFWEERRGGESLVA